VPLGREPLGVVGMGEHGRGEVRPAHGLAGLLARIDGGVVHREAELAQTGGHVVRAALAIGPGVRQALLEQGAAMVDPVAQHVQVLVRAVDRGDLGGGGDAHTVQGAGGKRLVHPVHRVVIRERQQLDARLGGVRHDVGDPQLAVGVKRMGLEVEGRRAHRREDIRDGRLGDPRRRRCSCRPPAAARCR
jgi:hypothetical protein